MTANPFALIRNHVPLPEAARRYGIRLDVHGKALCPFHKEKTPSFTIKGNRFRCFGCDASGSVIDLVANLQNISPLEAAKELDVMYTLGAFPDKALSPSEQRKAQEAARCYAKDKALAEQFDAWWHSAWHTVLWYKRYLEAERERLQPSNGTLTDEYFHILRELDITGYLLTIMTTDNEREKLDIYAGWRKKVQAIDSLRQGKSIA